MTAKSLLSRRDFPTMLGFNSVFDILENALFETKIPNFPKYDIKTKDTMIYIDVAVAGIPKDELSIVLEGGKLSIKHEKIKSEEEKDDDKEVIFRGISQRAFNLSFDVSDFVKVKDAKLENGILKIELENLVPEEKKPKQIEIK